MSVARAKRLARLEARRPTGPPFFDPFEALVTLLAGPAPAASVEPEAEWSPAMAEAMVFYDRLAKRLAQERAKVG